MKSPFICLSFQGQIYLFFIFLMFFFSFLNSHPLPPSIRHHTCGCAFVHLNLFPSFPPHLLTVKYFLCIAKSSFSRLLHPGGRARYDFHDFQCDPTQHLCELTQQGRLSPNSCRYVLCRLVSSLPDCGWSWFFPAISVESTSLRFR